MNSYYIQHVGNTYAVMSNDWRFIDSFRSKKEAEALLYTLLMKQSGGDK